MNITDDDGMIAIVNTDKYNSTLQYRDKWTWGELRKFLLKTNKDNLVIWATGSEAEWTVEIVKSPTEREAFRQFVQFIEVSDGNLFLTNFSDITMTLQFDNEKLPQQYNRDLIIPLDNGRYRVTVRQLFSPEDYSYDSEGKVNFEVCFEPENEITSTSIDCIAWADKTTFGEDSDMFLSNDRDELDDLLDEMIKERQ